VPFNFLYVYDYVINFGRTQAEEFLNYINPSGRDIDKQKKFAKVKLAAVRSMIVQLANCSFIIIKLVKA
jgi:hypothetical protein